MLQHALFVFERAIRSRVSLALAKVADYSDRVRKELLRAFIKLVSLFAATLTPNSTKRIAIVNHYRKFFSFF